MDVRLYGDTAVLTATGQFATSQKGGEVHPAHLRFIHVWVMRNGRWQMVAHQSLRLPDCTSYQFRRPAQPVRRTGLHAAPGRYRLMLMPFAHNNYVGFSESSAEALNQSMKAGSSYPFRTRAEASTRSPAEFFRIGIRFAVM